MTNTERHPQEKGESVKVNEMSENEKPELWVRLLNVLIGGIIISIAIAFVWLVLRKLLGW